MEMSQYHYLPLAPSFFAILVGLFIAVLILQSLRYAYISLGISPGTALFLLFASLVGSIFNIPIVQLPPEPVVSDRLIDFFGMQYTVPVVTHWRHRDRRECRRRGHPDLLVALSARRPAFVDQRCDRDRDRGAGAALAG